MVVTIYETKTDGWDGSGLLTTLERATTTQTVTATDSDEAASLLVLTLPTPVSSVTSISEALTTAASTPISTPATSRTHTSSLASSSTSAPTPSSAQLSTGSIVGIALGSVAGGVLIVVCLLFALGFRIQRARWRRHITPEETPQLIGDDPPAAGSTPGRSYGKAELPDFEYLQKVERLHDGSKPELDGTTALKSLWRLISVRSLRRGSIRHDSAELAAESLESGPHELPGDGIVQSSREEPSKTRDAT